MTLPQVPIPAGTPEAIYQDSMASIERRLKASGLAAPVSGGYVTSTPDHAPAGTPSAALKAIWRGQIVTDNFEFEATDHIPATSTDPSRLKALEKAVNQAKPMRGK